MRPLESVAALLAQAVMLEPAAMPREGGVIADGFDAELDELRAIDRNCGEFLLELEARERVRSGIANLKVEYNRVHGFYIEVTRAQSENVPDDYRRRQTLKNAERYITPELKAFEDKALSAQERALAREKLLYEQLLDRLAPDIPRLQRVAGALAEIDLLATFAERAHTLDFCMPELVREPLIEIEAGRHPVVEAQIATFIANDTQLGGGRQMLLVTGPNMGGKSTYMRQVALIALLAHCGSFVPARRASIGALDQIFTRIGAADDLAGGRSTFMVEMTEAAYILHHATPASLVLMDEIGRGTSTFDGLALAWAIARHLLDANKSLTLFATHYFELTRLAQEFRQLANVHLDAVEHKDHIVFLHSVEEGPANQSYGLQVAHLAGVPASVIRAAKKHLQQLENEGAARSQQPDLFYAAAATGAAFTGRAGAARKTARPRPRHADAERGARRALRVEEPARKMILRDALAMVVAAALSGAPLSAAVYAQPVTFAVFGDTPYDDAHPGGETRSYLDMLGEINRSDARFVVHIGDFKHGSTPCSDALFEQRQSRIRGRRTNRFIFVFGDNEWTDCWRSGSRSARAARQTARTVHRGRREPGRTPITLARQSANAAYASYRENVRWAVGNVLFVGLNVPGSNNNFTRLPEEYRARNAAVLAWLDEAFAIARAQDLRRDRSIHARRSVSAPVAGPTVTRRCSKRCAVTSAHTRARGARAWRHACVPH